MNKTYVLVALLVIVFVVGAVGILYLNSEVSSLYADYSNLASKYNTLLSEYSTLYSQYNSLYSEYTSVVSSYNNLSSSYNTLRSYYSALYSMFETLNSSYFTLSAEYSTLKSQYNELNTSYTNLKATYEEVSSEFNSISGYMTVANFITYMVEANTEGMVNEMTGPYPLNFTITAMPGQGSIIATPGNTTAFTYVTSHLAQLYEFVTVRGFIKEIIFSQYGNYTLGEALIAFSDQSISGTVNLYMVVTVVAKEVSLGNWQVVYVNINNSLYIYQYNFVVSAFDLVSALEQKNSPELISLLIGPYPVYVYIAAGPYSGNYSGAITVENTFINTIVSKDFSSIQFTPLYYTIQFTSNQTGTVMIYGNLTVTLVNGTTLTYPTELELTTQLLPNGQVQITGLNILNDVTYSEILGILPK